MGDAADNILSLFGLSDEDKKKFDTVVAKFEGHFVKKRNVIFERTKFNQRKQEEGESADEFVTDLYCLSEYCNYGELRDEMIRDQIVVGLRDANLSKKLQLVSDLTLEKAITAAQQKESVHKQQRVVRADGSQFSPKIDAIHTAKNGKKYKTVMTKGTVSKPPDKTVSTSAQEICTRCGKRQHTGKQQCPACDVIC